MSGRMTRRGWWRGVGVLVAGLAGCGGSTSLEYACDPACPAGFTCTAAGCQRADLGAGGGDGGEAVDLAGCGACPAGTPYCDGNQQCTQCLVDAHCPAGQRCLALGGGAIHACVPGCSDDARCAGGGPASCCGGQCTDLQADVANCGACGHACAFERATGACSGGACAIAACQAGWADCDHDPATGCEVSVLSDTSNCGACGTGCSRQNAIAACGIGGCYIGACQFGWDDCDGLDANGCETAVLSDARNCGACASACPPVPHARVACANATCGLSACDQGFADCDRDPGNGCEVTIASDGKNCGACGNACGNGQVCKNGGCTCAQCSFPHAKSKCVNLVCLLDACLPGFADCNGSSGDGCEVDTGGDPRNCGGCGMACGGKTPYCQGGVCSDITPSCLDVLRGNPQAQDGLYTIDPDGNGPIQPFQVWCDMTLDGGGWTAFFVGINGSPNLFAHFEDVDVACDDPATKCMRRLPPGLTTNNEFLATCGNAAVKFTVNQSTLTYFSTGTQGGTWMNNSNVAAVAGGAKAAYAGQTWTGAPNNKGWIVSAGDRQQPSTFCSSYNVNAQWDWCNGVVDVVSPIKLMYR